MGSCWRWLCKMTYDPNTQQTYIHTRTMMNQQTMSQVRQIMLVLIAIIISSSQVVMKVFYKFHRILPFINAQSSFPWLFAKQYGNFHLRVRFILVKRAKQLCMFVSSSNLVKQPRTNLLDDQAGPPIKSTSSRFLLRTKERERERERE